MTDAETADTLTQIVAASIAGDRDRIRKLANRMTPEERQALDQLHAVVQLTRLKRAGAQCV